MVPGYLSWFCDLITFGETPEGSRKKKRSTYYKTFDKRVGEGKATIARQEVQVQRGKNHKLELQNME